MKKVWSYQRNNRKGYYVAWYENGRQRTKLLPTKALAEHFKHLKYHQLNFDVFATPVKLPWPDIKREFLQRYDILGLAENTKLEARLFLDRFEKIALPRSSASIDQRIVDFYLLERRKQHLSSYTIKKDIERLKTMLAWMSEKHYSFGQITLPRIKVPPVSRKALTTKQIRWLFSRCTGPTWRVRILLSLVTGLRKSDIDNLPRSAINLKAATIDTESQKTHKAYYGRPIPTSATGVLQSYLDGLNKGQARLFADQNVRKEWERIRGNTKITRQQLRTTFSTLIQKIGSLPSAQALLEHHSSVTTTDFYTDRELILRWKVNQFPVKEWLSRHR